MNVNRRTLGTSVLFLFAAYSIFSGFGYYTLWELLKTDVAGTIVSSTDEPATKGPRYITHYSIRQADGSLTTYIAGPTTAYLPRSMPVGATIQKRKWELGYYMNGQWVSVEGPWGILFLGVISFCVGVFFLIKSIVR